MNLKFSQKLWREREEEQFNDKIIQFKSNRCYKTFFFVVSYPPAWLAEQNPFIIWFEFKDANRNDPICVAPIDIKRRKNRLLMFCYVPATRTAHNSLLISFFAAAVYSTNEANKEGCTRR